MQVADACVWAMPCCLRMKAERLLCQKVSAMTVARLRSDLVCMAATAADSEIGGNRAASNCSAIGMGPAAKRRTKARTARALAGRDE